MLAAQMAAAHVPRFLGEPIRLDVLGTEALQHPNAADGLFDHGGQLGRFLLHGHDRRMDPAGEPVRQQVDERQREQGDGGEQRIEDEQNGGDAKHGGEVGERHRDHHHEGVHLLEIGTRPGEELTGLGVIVEPDVMPLEVGEELSRSTVSHQRASGRRTSGETPHGAGDDSGDHDQPDPQQDRISPGHQRPVDRNPGRQGTVTFPRSRTGRP
ncbi:MAG: hypothetical protein R2715_18945 [Ilumatobacteraceae bacterium]